MSSWGETSEKYQRRYYSGNKFNEGKEEYKRNIKKVARNYSTFTNFMFACYKTFVSIS